MEALSYTRTAADPTEYLYNGGVEKNDLTGYYETFYRSYDPSIGRFHQIDIAATKFSSLSPYQFAFNDPVHWNDPLGDDPTDDAVSRYRNSFIINWDDLGDGGGGWDHVDGYESYNSPFEAFMVGANYHSNYGTWHTLEGGIEGVASRYNNYLAPNVGGGIYQALDNSWYLQTVRNGSLVRTDRDGNLIDDYAYGVTSTHDILLLKAQTNDGDSENPWYQSLYNIFMHGFTHGRDSRTEKEKFYDYNKQWQEALDKDKRFQDTDLPNVPEPVNENHLLGRDNGPTEQSNVSWRFNRENGNSDQTIVVDKPTYFSKDSILHSVYLDDNFRSRTLYNVNVYRAFRGDSTFSHVVQRSYSTKTVNSKND